MELIPVDTATKLILEQQHLLGNEFVSLQNAHNRTLAQPLVADRDFPPFDRVTMDGIALLFASYLAGQRIFKIQGLHSAGDSQTTLYNPTECLEVMTGAILPLGTDTVVRYEDIVIENGLAEIKEPLKFAQNIHKQGEDRKKGAMIVPENKQLRSPEIAVAASIGAVEVYVKKLPRVAIITSGDELVSVATVPLPHQLRTSNVYAIAALLQPYGIEVTMLHIPDDLETTQRVIADALLAFDTLLLSGGVSKGKKDFIPEALRINGVEQLFHRVAQTPGKPFWFGRKDNCVIFALPGNPVSSFMCARRYFIPWLRQTIGLQPFDYQEAILSEDFFFKSPLTYFLQVKLQQKNATLYALPLVGHGSGDFANLVDADGFLELPEGDCRNFKKGEIFRVWRF